MHPFPLDTASCLCRSANPIALLVLLPGLIGATSQAQDSPPPPRVPGSFDPVTARDLRNYPRDPVVNYLHMRLDIDIPDMNVPRLDAVQTLTLSPIAYPLAQLTLDAKLLEIKSVKVTGEPAITATFAHEGDSLRITFDPPIQLGGRRDLVTTYALNDPPLGLIWTPESGAWPGRPAQIHTQGQAEDSSYWFPCHDFPNLRLTTELIATVPPGYLVSSNGRLVSHSAESGLLPAADGRVVAAPPGADARQRFHWLQDTPHVNYLVSLVVGKFDVVDVGTRRLPMPVYVPPDRGRDVERTYGKTPKMISLFEKRFDEPYPWDRYAQVVVWNFSAGGMENTSATTLYDTAVLSREAAEDTDLEDLISHELAHQWFGDLFTCRSWEHIWLNEGFATYAESLWCEDRGGFEGYQAYIRAWFDSVIKSDKADAPYQAAMASKEYKHPDDVFGRDADPYAKGGAILHMLRQELGDEVFFRALTEFVDRFKFKEAETDDFRKVLEEVSGESLEQFFTQWCRRPGVPHIEVAAEWAGASQQLTLTAKQTQNIDGANPAFAISIPVWVRADGSTRLAVLDMNGREAAGTWVFTAEPDWVAIDPELAVLAEMKVTQPAPWLTEQLLRGPTLAARIQAARALAEDRAVEASAALWAVFADERQHDSLRSAAIVALSKRPGATWLDDLISARVRDPQVLEAAINAVADAASQPEPYPTVLVKARQYLASMAEQRGERVRSAATRAIGKIKDARRLPLVLSATETESQHDRLREAALESLADLDLPEGLPAAIRCAQPGVLSDSRETAIGTISRLAHHDRDAAYTALVPLLADRERNVWMRAVTALADLNDPRAAGDLERLAAAKRGAEDLRHIREAIARLSAIPPAP